MSKRTRDAEELKRRKKAKQRFKHCVRSVTLNRIWLMDSGDQKLSLNVKKNIAMLVRTQRKIGMLTLAEKALIRTPHSTRSVEERKKLVSLMAGLTCFAKIPPKVRARLVPYVNFMVLNPGRTIIKEGDRPMVVYFILTGEANMTKMVYDHVKQAYISRVEVINGPGDSLGDVEMIEQCPRKNTYTSSTQLELLVVYEEDFDRILRPFMTKQWMDKKKALMYLDYFDFLNEEQITNACKLGQLRQFEPLETIYYEDKGSVSYVYFVVSGECVILQCLNMRVTERGGNKYYELSDYSADDMSTLFHDLKKEELMKMLKEDAGQAKEDIDLNELTVDEEDNEVIKRKIGMRKMDIKSIEIACGLRKASNEALHQQQPHREIQIEASSDEDNESDFVDVDDEYEHVYREESSSDLKAETSDDAIIIPNFTPPRLSDQRGEKLIRASNMSKISKISKQSKVSRRSKKFAEDSNTVENEEGNTARKDSANHLDGDASQDKLTQPQSHFDLDSDQNETTSSSWSSSGSDVEQKTENHFIDVGSLTFGGIFGLGEKIEHRVIMARTTVQCLMLPRFWLLEKDQNPGNIWQRRRFYLDSTIPSREALFKDFLKTRKWQKFKKEFIQSQLDEVAVSNDTKVEDIPIICRIVETTDE